MSNLSLRQLTKSEISLLSRGLKFMPTPKRIDQAKLKQEVEILGRQLILSWHFRNDEDFLTAIKSLGQSSHLIQKIRTLL